MYAAVDPTRRPKFLRFREATGNPIGQHNIDVATGQRPTLRREYFDQITGEVIERGEWVERVQYNDGQDEDPSIGDTIEIQSVCPRDCVDDLYLSKSYYLVAEDDNPSKEAFVIIREALRKRNAVGLGEVKLKTGPCCLMLQPRNNGIVAIALRYPNEEVRDPTDYFSKLSDITAPPALIDLASQLFKISEGWPPKINTKKTIREPLPTAPTIAPSVFYRGNASGERPHVGAVFTTDEKRARQYMREDGSLWRWDIPQNNRAITAKKRGDHFTIELTAEYSGEVVEIERGGNVASEIMRDQDLIDEIDNLIGTINTLLDQVGSENLFDRFWSRGFVKDLSEISLQFEDRGYITNEQREALNQIHDTLFSICSKLESKFLRQYGM